jgi:ribonuclease HII
VGDGGRLIPYEDEVLRSGRRRPAGIDEAGRGPLAGPVVAAAVILPRGARIEGLRDSKLLTPTRRAALDVVIRETALAVTVAVIDQAVIDQINILRATHLAMARAAALLDPPADFLLVDGRPVPGLPCDHRAIVGGDRTCASIAAASIIAKVHRDALMDGWHSIYPEYGFRDHKGYGTPRHLEAVARHGPCPIHRLTFRGVREHIRGGG